MELHTDAPGAVFAPGRRLYAGTTAGEPMADRSELHVVRSSPFKGGLIVAFREITDRTGAERWRDRFLLAPADELEPPADGEVYIHDLVGMAVQLANGEPVGTVREVYELPQGLVLDVQRARDTVMVPFHASSVLGVDSEARLVTIDPPAGLLD